MTRVTFGDVSGSPATPPDRALSVAASCSLRELPRLRSRASRIADPLARARSAVLSPLSWPRDGTAPRLKGCALPAGLQRGFGSGAGGKRPPSLSGCDVGWRHSPLGREGLSPCQPKTQLESSNSRREHEPLSATEQWCPGCTGTAAK